MNYHVNRNGQSLGILKIVNLDELVRRRRAGEPTGSEMVWYEGKQLVKNDGLEYCRTDRKTIFRYAWEADADVLAQQSVDWFNDPQYPFKQS